MTRYCASCGTEVDESVAFCPTCGQSLDQAAEVEVPRAPAWPEEPAAAASPPAATHDAAQADWGTPMASGEPAPSAPSPLPPPSAAVAPPAVAPPRAGPGAPRASLPLTLPVTLSGWLIGIGSALAALGILIGLFSGLVSPIDLLLLLLLLGIAATVFLSATLPVIPHLRLATHLTVLIGFGMALERIASGRASLGALLLFLGAASAAIGVIIVDLGQDQPVGGPRT